MSGANRDLTGSAARHHEATGGNVLPGEINLPVGGDAAKTAETEGDSVSEAHGIRTARRGEFRGGRSMNLSSFAGARMVEPQAPQPDLSTRTAADYLPPQLKAQLIAEGKLMEDGTLVARALPVAHVPEQANLPAISGATGTKTDTVAEPRGLFGSLTGFFRKLF